MEILCREALDSSSPTSASIQPGSRGRPSLDGSGVGLCGRWGFRSGQTTPDVKVCEARRAKPDGAREIDMSSTLARIKSEIGTTVPARIEAVTASCPGRGVRSAKRVIERVADRDEKAGLHAGESGGPDFVKTSTGFGPGGATNR